MSSRICCGECDDLLGSGKKFERKKVRIGRKVELFSSRNFFLQKLRKYEHMSKLGLPYLPSTLVWTKKSLDKYPLVDPTYLSKKFGHFGIKSCHFTLFS